MKSTPEMRAQIRELMTSPQDDYDRAVECVLDDLDVMLGVAQSPAQPTAWRYTCADGSVVLMLKRLTDEQKRRGYYTGEDGEDEVDGDEALVGPFYWAEETPLYAAQPPAAPVAGLIECPTCVRRFKPGEHCDLATCSLKRCSAETSGQEG